MKKRLGRTATSLLATILCGSMLMTNGRIYAEDNTQETAEPISVSAEVTLSEDRLSAIVSVNAVAQEKYEVTEISMEGQEPVLSDTASFTVDSNGIYSVLVSYQPKAVEEIPAEEIEEVKKEEEQVTGKTEEGTASETENKEEVPAEPEAPADTETDSAADGTENTAETDQTEESAGTDATEPAAEEQTPSETDAVAEPVTEEPETEETATVAEMILNTIFTPVHAEENEEPEPTTETIQIEVTGIEENTPMLFGNSPAVISFSSSSDANGSITSTVLKGDANQDGTVSGTDGDSIQAIIDGSQTAPDAGTDQFKACDVNGDGVINADDISALSKGISGETVLPNAAFTFTITDQPSAGYHVSKVTIVSTSGTIVLKPGLAASTAGTYSMMAGIYSEPTVITGQSEAANTITIEHTQDLTISLVAESDANGTVTEKMLKGDANLDQVVNQDDYDLIIAEDLAAGTITNAVAKDAADVNSDGSIDTGDAQLVVNMQQEVEQIPSAISDFTYRVVDKPNSNYYIDTVTINGTAAAVPAGLAGSLVTNVDGYDYTVTVDRVGNTTVTGPSNISNNIQFTHKAIPDYYYFERIGGFKNTTVYDGKLHEMGNLIWFRWGDTVDYMQIDNTSDMLYALCNVSTWKVYEASDKDTILASGTGDGEGWKKSLNTKTLWDEYAQKTMDYLAQYNNNRPEFADAGAYKIFITTFDEDDGYNTKRDPSITGVGRDQPGYDPLKVTMLLIQKRPITITADSAEKKYDGTALSKQTYSVGGEYGLAEGQTIESVSMTASIQNAGTVENTVSGAKIVDAQGNDVTENYDITYVSGSLTVTSTSTPVDPNPGRTCQDDGYPAGYTWSDEQQACICTEAVCKVNTTPKPTATTNNKVVPPNTGEASLTSSPNPLEAAKVDVSEPTDQQSHSLMSVINGTSASWALLNLVAAGISVILGIILLMAKNRKEETLTDENGNRIYNCFNEAATETFVRSKSLKLIAVIAALLSVILFLLTEDLTQKMVISDQWTIIMILIMAVSAVCCIFGFHWKEEAAE